VTLDADRPALKQALVPVLEREIQEQASNKAVQATNARLAAAGYKPQVYSRPLNLFFLTEEGKRERLEPDAGGADCVEVTVRNTTRCHSQAELLALARQHPEQFSPNVVLRPLYQEMLLPNLAYIGGGAEVAYWFQLKDVFAAYGVPFPIVLLRNSALYRWPGRPGKAPEQSRRNQARNRLLAAHGPKGEAVSRGRPAGAQRQRAQHSDKQP
jgi:uncharacterized protein YllA (UPF0747 family)